MDKGRLVVYVSIAVVIISLLNIGFEMTGRATTDDTGELNVTILSLARINFTTDSVDFGSGNVLYGADSASIDTEGGVNGGNWSAFAGTTFTLENVGNQNLSLDIASGKTAAAFIGGTSPGYEFKYSDGEAGSCANQSSMEDYAAISTGGTTICNPFYAKDANDEITIDINLTIPSDSNSGTQTDTITATGTVV